MPSLVTEVLAWEMRRQFLGDARRPGKLTLLPPVRVPVPDREPVAPVPTKYRKYVGDHADHPGEGLGASARRRAKLENQGQGKLFA